MAMTPYTGETLTIANIGTTPQERAMETSEFKMAFSKDFHEFVEWFNETHNGEINEHMAESATEEKLGHVKVDGETILINEDGVISGAALTNKNLLHNWDFRNPVNQRGQSEYVSDITTGFYTIDRWYLNWNNDSVTVDSVNKNITITAVNTSRRLCQKIGTLKAGTYTFSADVISATNSWSLYCNGTTKPLITSATTGIISTTFTVAADTDDFVIGLQSTGASTLTLKSVKLELGSVSTLANDPPADYQEQLSLCKPIISTVAPTSYIGQDGQWQVY